MGFSMLQGKSMGSDDAADTPSHTNTSLTPLILFAASPGTMTGVITLAVAHKSDLPVAALTAIAVSVVVTFCVTLIVARAGGKPQGGFVRDTATRFMGLIVIAMGIQFAQTGIKSFMA
jgi:multiple antibiotic resistance protein